MVLLASTARRATIVQQTHDKFVPNKVHYMDEITLVAQIVTLLLFFRF